MEEEIKIINGQIMINNNFLSDIDFPLPEYVRKENGIC